VTTGQLRATAFRGDADVDQLHSFFRPEHQFAGDTLWSFGTSLKSAYVNSFEFMNHAPVVQLWRDDAGTLQAVSRISLGTGEWFHLAAPAYRHKEITEALVRQADSAFALLTDRTTWHTVRYHSSTAEIGLLQHAGYVRDGIAEVFMVRSLDEPIAPATDDLGVTIRVLDPTDAKQVHERALAQVDAFSEAEPTASETAWITRSLPHQLSYGRPSTCPGIIAANAAGAVLAFADFFIDRSNRIGEFEPVGTRKSARRCGLGRSVTIRGLQEMRGLGMTQAIVRTGHDNRAAIATYESVGFETTDLLVRFRKDR
jgi:ribosomal protein S18 acetylase RimI-like enzyme